MPKRRTTGCLQQHFGKICRDCTRIRVRRLRARRRNTPTSRLPLTDAQRLADNAARYVREYLRRGAIAPPDACERCELEVQVSPSRPLRPLRFFHPDPTQPQLVAWLCVDCYRRVRATGESLTLSWQWPGLTAHRSRKPPNLARYVAATSAALDDCLLTATATAPGLRPAAFIGTLVRALAPGERERLFAAGSLAGPRWQPTADPRLDALLRAWIFAERSDRSATARSAGGMIMTPLPREPRRTRAVLPETPPAAPRPPFDREASLNAIFSAIARLDEVETQADEINNRVAQFVR